MGKDWERKGGPSLLRAWESISDEFPDARMDLVGNHPDRLPGNITGHGYLPAG